MEKLNKDELFTIASKLDIKTLLNFCSSNSKFNNLICKRSQIWKFLLNRDYDFNYQGDKNPRELYLELTRALSYYYELEGKTMPKKFTQKEIFDIFYDINKKGYEIDFALYFTAAKYGAIFLMNSLENNIRLAMRYKGSLWNFIMDMEMSALEYLLSRGSGIFLGIGTALEEVINQGDIEKAKLILKYYEIVKMIYK